MSVVIILSFPISYYLSYNYLIGSTLHLFHTNQNGTNSRENDPTEGKRNPDKTSVREVSSTGDILFTSKQNTTAWKRPEDFLKYSKHLVTRLQRNLDSNSQLKQT